MVLAARASRHCRASNSAGDRFFAGSRSRRQQLLDLGDQLLHLALGHVRIDVGAVEGLRASA